MDSDSVCSEWPYFIWRIKYFFNLTRLTKLNCCIGEDSFNLILRQRCSTNVEDDYFEMCLENNNDEVNPAVKFRTTTYIVNRKGERRFNTEKVNCPSDNKFLAIWYASRKSLLEASEDLKQENGDTVLICICGPETNMNIESHVLAERAAKVKEADDNLWCSLKALSRDFRKILHTSGADMVIKYGNQRWSVHRHILTARCPKFLEIFSDESESAEHLGIPKLSNNTFAAVMDYIYTGSLPEMDVGETKRVYRFAHKYEMKDLTGLCTDILSQLMTEDNACEILKFADRYKEDSLKDAIVTYIITKEVFLKNDWNDFCECNTKLALEVYRACVGV